MVVKKGDVEIFRKTMKLINQKLQKRDDQAMQKEGREEIRGYPAGEVTFHKVIAAHDIMVIHVLDANSFIEWVERYFKAFEGKNPKVPEAMKAVVSDYIEEGFLYRTFKDA